jgi:HB1/ASXL restriction endonuclease-like protein with HTH domain
MPKELTWRKAIEKVLSQAAGAMHYKDLTDKIIEDGLRVSLGATPTRTVNAHLTTAIKNEGESCPFQKAGKGLFIWKAAGTTPTHVVPVEDIGEEEEVQYAVISSFGMFWRREAVEWTSNPKLLGMEQIGADAVDFNKQNGIYLLYDGREIIYVGRATDRPLGKRLYEHTVGRLSTRWDRFSWFGMLPVSDAGVLGGMPDSFPAEKIIPAMEAILIEALEPRQNRKRGDDLSAVEYFQKEDPEIQKKRVRQTVEAALNKL